MDSDLILNAIEKMSKKKSDLARRRSTRTRREKAGKSVAPAMDRPGWLPEDWTMEIKKRVKSSTRRKRIDRYYICPLSGKRLRSRLEVMRVLNNKFLEHSASESAPYGDGGYKQPTVELKSSEVKRTIARRHLFATEEPLSDAITGGDSPQEPALSSLTHASAQLDNGASETSCSTPKYVQHLDHRVCVSQLESEPNPMVHVEEQPAMEVLPEPGNEKLSEPLVCAEGEIPIPDANLSEEAQFKLTKKQSQPQRYKRHDSINTEAVGSLNNGRKQHKRTVAKRKSIPIHTSKQLAGVMAEPISNFGTGKELKSPKAAQIEQAQPIVPGEAHEKYSSIIVEEEAKCPFEEASKEQQADDIQPTVPKEAHKKDASACITVEEDDVMCLDPFKEASNEQQYDELQPTMPMDTDASCSSHQIVTPETDKLKEKLETAESFVEQNSQEQHHHNDPLTNTLPFGDSWSDPCIEFAFKTLTSDFPVLEDIAAIQDYFNRRHISSQSPNLSVGPTSSALGGPSSLFRDNDDKLCPLPIGKAGLSNPTSKKTM